MDASEPAGKGPAQEPVDEPTDGAADERVSDEAADRPPAAGTGLRAPQGCAEWAVVILGVIWAVLAIVFVVALILRLNGSL